jgi:predicted XRE-type DNA-binding protein
MNEEFKEIALSPRYLVSNLGRVISLYSGKDLLQTKGQSGYLTVVICDGFRVTQRVHRLIAEAFVPNPDNKPYVNHIDCIKTNNLYTNLEWTTPAENIEHAYANNRITNIGENANLAKISRETAMSVLILSREGFKNCEIVEALSLTKSIVSKIVRGKTWKELHTNV